MIKEALSNSKLPVEQPSRELSIFTNSSGEIQGEEISNYQLEWRALYFNVKTLILRDIDIVDSEQTVS